jgi:hypothetical protein
MDTPEINLEIFTEQLQGQIIAEIMLGYESSKIEIDYEQVDGTFIKLPIV